MLVENSLQKALEAFLNGREVIVLTDMGDGSIMAERIDEMFPKESKYLVNMPAIESPEFKKALGEMVESRNKTGRTDVPMEDGTSKKEADTDTETVPKRSREINWKKKR